MTVHPHAYCLWMLSSYMHSIHPLYMFVQAATDFIYQAFCTLLFFLCIAVCILCISILFDNYSMCVLSSHTTGPSYMT